MEMDVSGRADWEMGSALQQGELSLTRDFSEAARLYEKSAKAGFSLSMIQYATCLDKGIGVAVNKEHAIMWAKKALASGDDYTFALYHFYLIGVVLSPLEAMEEFPKSKECLKRAAPEFPEAYLLWELMTIDPAEKMRLLKLGAAAGNDMCAKKIKDMQPYEARDTFSSSKQCAFCKRSNQGLKVCSGCHVELYCGANCQSKHWPVHRKECRKVHPNEKGPCSLNALRKSGVYMSQELEAIEQCRCLLRNAPRKRIMAKKKASSMKQNSVTHVDVGRIKCVSQGRLSTTGLATCLALVICGESADGNRCCLMQHLSGHNFSGQPLQMLIATCTICWGSTLYFTLAVLFLDGA
jgi:hypothetical protein